MASCMLTLGDRCAGFFEVLKTGAGCTDPSKIRCRAVYCCTSTDGLPGFRPQLNMRVITGLTLFCNTRRFARPAESASAKCEPMICFCRIHKCRTSKLRSKPVVAPQITMRPNLLAKNTLAGKVALPTCSKTTSGPFRSPEDLPDLFFRNP